ncbi:MAG TPA: class I SAM-dependent methyltransferase [Actinospica sp.]|nr:class I SAM-dependent methyltransferase [Actinospica sp.]
MGGTAGATDVIAGTQETYRHIAAAYAEHWDGAETRWLHDEAVRLAAELPPGALVADVGCGPGNDTVRLRGLGLRAHGFDLSHAMLTARAVPGQVRADLRALPLPDGAIDAVWCVAVLLHIPRDLLPGALAELRRVLRPGGVGLITIAEGAGEGWERFPHQRDGEHRRYYVYHSAEDFTALLAAAGLRIRDTVRHSSHRDWVSLHVRRDPGVH